jgi:RHS repeat-associated protein
MNRIIIGFSRPWLWLVVATCALTASTQAQSVPADANPQTSNAGESWLEKVQNASFFKDRLQWVGSSQPSEADSQACWEMGQVLFSTNTLVIQLAALETFISQHPDSAWTPSLEANLAKYYREHGRFSLALEHWQSAWLKLKKHSDPNAKAVGDFIMAHWAELLARLGSTEALQKLYQETQGRTLDSGPLQQLFNRSQEAFGQMVSSPEWAHRCGWGALHSAAQVLHPGDNRLSSLIGEAATREGLSLQNLAATSARLGVPMIPVQVPGARSLPVPSVVHFQVGHFGTIIARRGDRYLLADSALDQPAWVSFAEILAEASGFFLVPADSVPSNGRRLAIQEAAQVLGRGYPNLIPDNEDSFLTPSSSMDLPDWSVSEPFVNLWIQAPVLRYPQAPGLTLEMGLTFRQRNTVSASSYYNFGNTWESSWLGYVDYTSLWDPEPPGSWNHDNIGPTYLALGGVHFFAQDGSTREYYSQGVMTNTATPQSAIVNFSMVLPTGSWLKFSAQQSFGLGQRRAYLKYIYDPQGREVFLNYSETNGIMRLNSVNDVMNRTTQFYYKSANLGRVTEIVDPYNRTNRFSYSGSGALTNITNPEGYGAGFAYDGQGVVTNLATPYGTTTFAYTVNTNTGNVVSRSLLVTSPAGAKQLYMYRDQSTKLNSSSQTDLIPFSYPAIDVPETTGLTNTFDNTWMDARNTFYWPPLAYEKLSSAFRSSGNFNDLTVADYQLARLRHWLRDKAINSTVSATLSFERAPSADGFEEGQKLWFDHYDKSPIVGTNLAGQTITNWYQRGNQPWQRFRAMRLLDGTSAFTYNEYNFAGNPTNTISTWASTAGLHTRTNLFVYDFDSGIDLLRAYGPLGELTVSNSWSTNHLLLSSANVLGELTTYAYMSTNPFAPTSVRAPNGLLTTNFYYTTGTIGFLERTEIPPLGVTNWFTYTNALVLTHKNQKGVIVTNTYDRLQRVVAQADPRGTVRSVFTNSLLSHTVNVLGYTNRFGYDAWGRKIWQADPLKRTNWWNYSTAGLVLAQTNALGEATRFSYDNLGRLLMTTFPDNACQSNRFNRLGQLVSVTDARGVSTTSVYNHQGLLVVVSNALGRVQSSSYDIHDWVTNTVDANGVSLTRTFDPAGRVLTALRPDGGIERFGYTKNIGLTSFTNPLSQVTMTEYDLAGRKIAETNANQEVIRWTYSSSGELTRLTDAKGHNTLWGYDIFGQATSKTNHNGIEILRLRYDSAGRLTNRWTAAKGYVQYTYDPVGNLTNTDYAASPDIRYQYDPLNRLTNMVDALGVTSFGFGNNGQMLMEDGPWEDDRVDYSFAVHGMLTGVSLQQPGTAPWTLAYGYDTINRLTNITSQAGIFGYSYMGPNSLSVARIAMPGGNQVTNSYDTLVRLTNTCLKNAVGITFNFHSYAYDLGNRVTNHIRYDNSVVTYGYDSVGQLKSANAKEQGGAARLHEQLGYAYDAAGNLAYRTNNALLQSFSVDTLNQLTSAGRSGTLTVAGTTSSTATNVTVNGLASSLYSDATFAKAGLALADGTNAFTAVARDTYGRTDTNTVTLFLPASVPYVYDLNGNLLSDGRLGYDYDDENQLIRITSTNGWRTEFVYDGKLRRRIRREYTWISGAWGQSSETRYVYTRGLVLQERAYDAQSGSLQQAVTYTRGIDLSGTEAGAGGIGGLLARSESSPLISQVSSAYYHCDGSGSVTALISTNGVLLARYSYDAFGNLLSAGGPLAASNLYRYASKEHHDRSGLVFFGRRFYVPSLQRWLNADPLRESGGLNLFAYVGNSPMAMRDAWGLQGMKTTRQERKWESMNSHPALMDNWSLAEWADIQQEQENAFDGIVNLVLDLIDAFVGDHLQRWDYQIYLTSAAPDWIQITCIPSKVANIAVQDLAGLAGAGLELQNMLLGLVDLRNEDLMALPFFTREVGALEGAAMMFQRASLAAKAFASERLAAKGGIQFGTAGDTFLLNAAKAAPVDGMLDVAVHGSPLTVEIGGISVNHRVLGSLIQRNPAFNGQGIRLLSCETGNLPNGFAQNLANKLGVSVHAPNDIIWAFDNGRVTIGLNALDDSGAFIQFLPGGGRP